jgi:choice-of-anchor B domain-containing protein
MHLFRHFLVLVLAMQTLFSYGQATLHTELVSHLNYTQNCNDVWGYVDEQGVEYAILGTVTGTAVISLENPTQPREVLFIPGANSIWRDMKNWNNHVYVTADQGMDGILVIDMAGAPDNISYAFWRPELEVRGQTSFLNTCHNLFIDDKGYAYIAGCNLNAGGVMILDVHTDPGTPIFVSACDPRYSHDAMVRNDTLFSSDINAGVFSVQDVRDKRNPSTLALQRTSFEFTHNAWVSDDGKYLFTTDERPNAFVDAYDISDVENIRRVDRIRPIATEGTGVIPHNVHYYDGYLVISWYTDGMIVVDVSQPDHMVKVGQYDTYLPNNQGFNGCWGAYPWLPSGLILASDINSGLYVIRPDYVRASRVRGTVRDKESGELLSDVRVNITDAQANTRSTDIQGRYKTGIAAQGTREVTFTKPGFFPLSMEVDLVNGQTIDLDVELVPLQRLNITGSVVEKGSKRPLGSVQVSIISQDGESVSLTDTDGFFTSKPIGGEIVIIAGTWGYQYFVDTVTVLEEDFTIEIELEPGYQDDFVFDYGWTVEANALRGNWERGVPEPTIFNNAFSNPNVSYPFALGDKCYVTGLQGGAPGDHDLDDGTTTLISPRMDLSNASNPQLRFAYWFFNDGGFGVPNDTMKVYLRNGQQQVEIFRSFGRANRWELSPNFTIKELIPLSDAIQIVFEASDLPGSGHLVEAAVDYFLVWDEESSADRTLNTSIDWSIFPNPAGRSAFIRLDNSAEVKKWVLMDLTGRSVHSGWIDGSSILHEISLEGLASGMYFIAIQGENGKHLDMKKLIISPISDRN